MEHVHCLSLSSGLVDDGELNDAVNHDFTRQDRHLFDPSLGDKVNDRPDRGFLLGHSHRLGDDDLRSTLPHHFL